MKVLKSVLYSLVILLVATSLSAAQTTTAAFQGTVMDPSGAVLPGVQVTASNVDTGLKRTTITNEEGRFLLSELPPGPYELNVSLTGFETLVRKGLTLTVGQQANLSLTMKVGAVDQQVVVTGDAPIVETTQSSVSGVVEEKRITELPLNGRDFTQLALVEPATVSLRNTGTGEVGRGFGTRMSVAGSRPDQQHRNVVGFAEEAAQLAEHQSRKLEVAGSIPVFSTTLPFQGALG